MILAVVVAMPVVAGGAKAVVSGEYRVVIRDSTGVAGTPSDNGRTQPVQVFGIGFASAANRDAAEQMAYADAVNSLVRQTGEMHFTFDRRGGTISYSSAGEVTLSGVRREVTAGIGENGVLLVLTVDTAVPLPGDRPVHTFAFNERIGIDGPAAAGAGTALRSLELRAVRAAVDRHYAGRTPPDQVVGTVYLTDFRLQR